MRRTFRAIGQVQRTKNEVIYHANQFIAEMVEIVYSIESNEYFHKVGTKPNEQFLEVVKQKSAQLVAQLENHKTDWNRKPDKSRIHK